MSDNHRAIRQMERFLIESKRQAQFLPDDDDDEGELIATITYYPDGKVVTTRNPELNERPVEGLDLFRYKNPVVRSLVHSWALSSSSTTCWLRLMTEDTTFRPTAVFWRVFNRSLDKIMISDFERKGNEREVQ